MANSRNFSTSLELIPYVEEIEELSDQDKAILWKACKENDQVYNAFLVRQKIYNKIGMPPQKAEQFAEDAPF